MTLKELKEKYKNKEVVYADLSSGFKLGTMSVNDLEGNLEDEVKILDKSRVLKSKTVYELNPNLEFIITDHDRDDRDVSRSNRDERVQREQEKEPREKSADSSVARKSEK